MCHRFGINAHTTLSKLIMVNLKTVNYTLYEINKQRFMIKLLIKNIVKITYFLISGIFSSVTHTAFKINHLQFKCV